MDSGLRSSIKRAVCTLTQLVSTRLALLANELYEERLHWEQMLLYFFAALFFLGMAIVLLTVFIVVLFWETHRLAALAVLMGLFSIAGMLLVYRLQHLTQMKSKLFSVSLAEFEKDRNELADKNVSTQT